MAKRPKNTALASKEKTTKRCGVSNVPADDAQIVLGRA